MLTFSMLTFGSHLNSVTLATVAERTLFPVAITSLMRLSQSQATSHDRLMSHVTLGRVECSK